MSEQKRKKIVIVNAHWSNRGDEAALRAMLDELIRRCDCNIKVIFKDKEPVKQFPYKGKVTCFSAKFLPHNIGETIFAVICRGNLNSISSHIFHHVPLSDSKDRENLSFRKMVRCIRKADFIIYAPGGSVICNRFWWKKQLEYLIPFLCAQIYKIPMVVAAPSIGPFDKDISKKFILKTLLKIPKVICVREDISKNYLSELGVKRNVITTIDTAFLNKINPTENKEILREQEGLETFLRHYKRVIGMTLSDFSWHVKYSKEKELNHKIENIMRTFIEKMKQEEVGVILIPQLFGNQNDRIYLEQFQDSNTFLLSDQLDAYFQQYLISQLYAVVGMRYHSNIFAAKASVPFLAIAYEEKMQGFMEMWDLQKYLIRLEDLTIDKLYQKWKCMEEEYKPYKETLKQYQIQWRKKAKKTLDVIEYVLYRENIIDKLEK